MRWIFTEDWIPSLLLIAATILAYWPALHGGFLWDDDAYISTNHTLRSLDGLWAIWSRLGATEQYYPLTFTLFWVGYHLWGLDPLGYHLLTLSMHCVTAVLLWQILARLRVRGAFLAGALFALHPVCVMSAAWMTELKNTLSGALALGAAWAYLRFAGLGVYARGESLAGKVRSAEWVFYVLVLVLFQLALLAKTAVSFLPVTLFLIVWWQRERLSWDELWPLLPLLGLAVGMGEITSYVERHSGGASGGEYNIGFPERVLISGRSFWFYLGKLFFPYRLTFIYPRWPVEGGRGWQWVYPVATVGLLGGLWGLRGRLGKGPLVAMLHFYLCTSFLILILVLYMTRYSFVSDHWQYFGCMGVMALVGWGMSIGLGWFEKRRPFVKPVCCGTLLLVLGILTWRQCGMYANLETLWRTTIARNPDASMAYNNLGIILLRKDQTDKAIVLFRKALEIQPDYANAQDNLGLALLRKGQVDEAFVHFQKAVEIQPDDGSAQNNLGNIFLRKGQWDQAFAHFQKALEIEPDNPMTHYNLGTILLQKGRMNDAIAHLQRALQLRPDYLEAHYNLGMALLQKGRASEAAAHFRKALEINPDYVKAHFSLGTILLLDGQADKAIIHFEKVLEIQPDYAEAQFYLGMALLQTEQMDGAIVHLQKAVELQPSNVQARSNLGFALLKRGQARKAIAQFQRVLEASPGNAGVQNNLAWILATCPETSLRNGTEAVKLAQQADQISGGNNPAMLATLAAAQAEVGHFSDALATAQKALVLATTQTNTAVADALRTQLKFYQAGSPFRDNSLTNTRPAQSGP